MRWTSCSYKLKIVKLCPKEMNINCDIFYKHTKLGKNNLMDVNCSQTSTPEPSTYYFQVYAVVYNLFWDIYIYLSSGFHVTVICLSCCIHDGPILKLIASSTLP